MIRHFALTVPVDDDDVKIIKEQLRGYLENIGNIYLEVLSESEEVPSVELQKAVKNLFVNLLLTVAHSDFERVQ